VRKFAIVDSNVDFQFPIADFRMKKLEIGNRKLKILSKS